MDSKTKHILETTGKKVVKATGDKKNVSKPIPKQGK